MTRARIEHANFTVTNADSAAETLVRLFDWRIRWSGSAIHGGRTVHVGTDEAYLALYAPPRVERATNDSYTTLRGLNHVGIVVDDLDAMEQRVLEAGFETHSHQDYEPGRRFYFRDREGVEYEVVAYD